MAAFSAATPLPERVLLFERGFSADLPRGLLGLGLSADVPRGFLGLDLVSADLPRGDLGLGLGLGLAAYLSADLLRGFFGLARPTPVSESADLSDDTDEAEARRLRGFRGALVLGLAPASSPADLSDDTDEAEGRRPRGFRGALGLASVSSESCVRWRLGCPSSASSASCAGCGGRVSSASSASSEYLTECLRWGL